jgi:HSP20 family protein
MWDEEDFDLMPTSATSTGNISLSEDDLHDYVDAAMPGINPDEIDITYDKGMLWIRGETTQEDIDKNKKYYQRASNSFSYRITLPTDIDENAEPQASCDNGMLMLTFNKSLKAKPKKISVKGSKNGQAKQAKSKKADE